MRGMVAFACALVLATCAAAQAGGWPVVQALAAGSPVVVRRSRAASVKGRLVAVSDSGLDVLTSRGARRSIARAQVTRVYVVGRSHERRDALIGAGVFGAGVVLALNHVSQCYAYNGPCHKVEAEVLVGSVFAAGGAAVGAVLGLIGHRRLVYKREFAGNSRDWKPSRQPKFTATAQRTEPAR